MEYIIKKNNSYNESIQTFIKDYKKNKYPIEVNFRNIVSIFNKPERATHLIHNYPAKLLMHIPYFFLNNNVTGFNSEIVVDPFCGSGTVLLESLIAGKNSFGVDSNPLARMISEVKTEKYNISKLIQFKELIFKELVRANHYEIANEELINYWFTKKVKIQLSNLLFCINKIPNSKYKKFFQVCFSNCVRKVSVADLKISVPVKLKEEKYANSESSSNSVKKRLNDLKNINVYDKYSEIVNLNIKRVNELNGLRGKQSTAKVISCDVRKINEKSLRNEILKNDSVDLIITSPPYAGAQKYIRASKLNLLWLNLADKSELKLLDRSTIGRENYSTLDYENFKESGLTEADVLLKKLFKKNPLRTHIASNYLLEMKEAFLEIFRILKPEGYLVLIIGNNYVCGKEFKTHEYISSFLKKLGLNLLFELIDDIKSYGLMTKRNKTANIITREHILVFKK